MLAVQGVSYALITSVLLVYCYAGTIPMIIPSAYFLSGIGLVSVFVVLSEAHFNDRFEDHYLTIFQVAGHVALQLCFLLAAPEIGFAFLSVVFLIFGFGALRMTSRQAIITWTLTMIGLAPIFLLQQHPDRPADCAPRPNASPPCFPLSSRSDSAPSWDCMAAPCARCSTTAASN